MESVTQALAREHRIIQKVVAVMVLVLQQLELQHNVDPDILRDIVQFMRIFGDQCHHGKEESFLFPLLEQKGLPETGCPLRTLQLEHQHGRHHTDMLSAACSTYIADSEAGRLTLMQALETLITLYPAHMWKEEYLLFPMVDKMLSPQEHELLLRQFKTAHSDIGVGAHHAYEILADDLRQRVSRCEQCSEA
jgi:hemerythrin-like domain-containing protein